MSDDGETAAPLAGVSVIELGTMITAPYAAMALAELGASVIKVENPDGGDPFRGAGADRYGPNFVAYNHSKRSVVLDLKTEDGLVALRALIESSDVLIENFRAGVLDKFGLTAQALQRLNPRLIHCSITGFGADGPYRRRPAFDAVASALSGLYSLAIDPENPHLSGVTVSDNVTGLYAANGVLAALHERERTQRGRRVEVNMLEASIAFAPDPFAHYTQTGVEYGPTSRIAASQCFAFACADGGLLAVHLSLQAKFWNNLLAALNEPQLAADPRFSDRPGRVRRYDALRDALSAIFAARDRPHWIARLEAHDVPFAPVHTLSEVMDDPQIAHLETFQQARHPTLGVVTMIRSPVRLQGVARDNSPPPTLGQHTAEILEALREAEAPLRGGR